MLFLGRDESLTRTSFGSLDGVEQALVVCTLLVLRVTQLLGKNLGWVHTS